MFEIPLIPAVPRACPYDVSYSEPVEITADTLSCVTWRVSLHSYRLVVVTVVVVDQLNVVGFQPFAAFLNHGVGEHPSSCCSETRYTLVADLDSRSDLRRP